MGAVRADTRSARDLRIVTAAIVYLATVIGFVSVSGPAASATTSGTELWARHYDGPASGADAAYGVAVSPDGATVFVTGQSAGDSDDFATVAYAASTGARVWVRRYDGPANDYDQAVDIAAGPDGSMVFVTGVTGGKRSWATIASTRRPGPPCGSGIISEARRPSPSGRTVERCT